MLAKEYRPRNRSTVGPHQKCTAAPLAKDLWFALGARFIANHNSITGPKSISAGIEHLTVDVAEGCVLSIVGPHDNGFARAHVGDGRTALGAGKGANRNSTRSPIHGAVRQDMLGIDVTPR